MKRYIMVLAAVLVLISTALASVNDSLPIVPEETDNDLHEQQDTVTATDNRIHIRINQEATVRLHELQQKEQELNTRLEDARNYLGTSVEGASARTQERYNILQDSICLDLRSQITDVQLQIADITTKK